MLKGNSLNKLEKLTDKLENLTIVRTVCSGLLNIIPILIIGAFALILQTFPVTAYQNFVQKFAGGRTMAFLSFVYSATFGVLSVYMTMSISRAYIHLKGDIKSEDINSDIGAMIASLISFFILAGAYLPEFSTDNVGPKSMFLAVITGIGASTLYYRLNIIFSKRKRRFFSSGADKEFNQMLSYIVPVALTAIIFALFNLLIIYAFDVDSFRMLLVEIINKIFSFGKVGFFKGFLFVLLSSLLWFFGIHGSDTLESVMQQYFAPGLEANQTAVAAGSAPQSILTKEFFDCFVLIGGCGSAICLLIAILAFSRNRARRGLGISAAVPMIFNINEMMVFGLPIIFNPIMLIPFITVPLVCYSIAYFAMSVGLVPVITHEVAWTTPVILGGFHATGSVAGSILQVVNVAIGVLIYTPFVRMLDKRDEKKYIEEFSSFIDYFRENEQMINGVRLIEQKNVYGEFAKVLCAEIEHGLKDNVVLAYQPQYNYDGKCVGVEALLRWNHPIYGLIYPPVVVKLAEEGNFLPELEEAVMLKAISDREKVLERFGKDIKISVNVTGNTIVTDRYLAFCKKLASKYDFSKMNMGLEVTEQAALSFDQRTIGIIRKIKDLGLALSIDDFSMGQTSINYLKENLFDYIKLDGSLVKGLFKNQNCKEIILSISKLAEHLSIKVLAEYVETKEQRDTLHELGCDLYQGYLYSPAVFIKDE